jgi:predicted acylesterase/phospholipase RssA
MGVAAHRLGLALSGGGSRAMAFHRGTLRALNELKVDEQVNVVSTVSGGSVFGAAWLCRKGTTPEFLESLVGVLKEGFIGPAVASPKVLKILLPGFTVTHRLAEVFSEKLLNRWRLDQLPEKPLLCLNASVMNHAMPGRFSRGGFSCAGVGAMVDDHYPEVPLQKRDLGFGVAASACFPFALPPLTLGADELLPLEGELTGQRALYLTDGGVLENLGVERLLNGDSHFSSEHIIVSDAGVHDTPWAPTLLQRVLSFLAFLVTPRTLSRLLTMMNNKEVKTERQLLVARVGAAEQERDERQLWFARIDTTWERFFTGISVQWRQALAKGGTFPDKDAKAPEVVAFLEANGVDLAPVRAMYAKADGDRSNAVGTNFTGLSDDDLGALERHARWQIYACRAVYGDLPAS